MKILRYLLVFLLVFLFSCSWSNDKSDIWNKNNTSEIKVLEWEKIMTWADNKITVRKNTPDENRLESMEKSKNEDFFWKNFSNSVIWENYSSWELIWYFAKPKISWNYPWIVMIHEWWWLNNEIKYMADLLANDWYNVFAIDLYKWEVATTPERARELSTSVRSDKDTAIKKMWLAYDFLKSQNNNSKIASLWWCFWWQQSLNLSLNKKLDATIIYYWNLITDKNELKSISWPVLWIFGWDDQIVTVNSVNEFKKWLNDLWIDNKIYIYPQVWHAFANPTWDNYSKSETIDAWERTIKFLNDNLKS